MEQLGGYMQVFFIVTRVYIPGYNFERSYPELVIASSLESALEQAKASVQRVLRDASTQVPEFDPELLEMSTAHVSTLDVETLRQILATLDRIQKQTIAAPMAA